MKERINVLFVGECGVGKSTICGRILKCSGKIENKDFERLQQLASEHGRKDNIFAWIFDSLRDERYLGITIKSKRKYIDLPSGKQVALISSPGLRKYIKNTIKPLFHTDCLALVFDGSIFAKDEEIDYNYYLQIMEMADALGIRNYFVLISHVDEIEVNEHDLPQLLSEMHQRVSKKLSRSRLSNLLQCVLPVCPFSEDDILTYQFQNFPSLRNVLERVHPKSFIKSSQLIIALSGDCKIGGVGTVAVGSVISGQINRGDVVYLAPMGLVTPVKDIVCFGETIETAYTGDFVSFATMGVRRSQTGCIAVSNSQSLKNSLKPVTSFDATIKLTPSDVDFTIKDGCSVALDAHHVHVFCKVRSIVSIAEEIDVYRCSIDISKDHVRGFCVLPYNQCKFLGVFCLRFLGNIIAVGKVNQTRCA